MNRIMGITQMGSLVFVLLFVTSCSEFPETKFIRGAIVQTNVSSIRHDETQPVIIKSKSPLPTVKLQSSFIVFQMGESRIMITDKNNRKSILSRTILYNDRFISDVEAQVFEASKLMERIEAETDSLGPTPLIANN